MVTATIESGERAKRPFDLKVVDGGDIHLRLDRRSKYKYAVFCKCSRCGYVFRSVDYWRRRGGWARGKVEKLMLRCLKCGRGKLYRHFTTWSVQVERLSENALDSSIQLMEIADASNMRKIKRALKLF